MTRTQIEALEALAKAATPGPWIFENNLDERDLRIRMANGGVVADTWLNGNQFENAAYIAAANPTAILSLLDALDAANAEIARLKVDARRYRWLREHGEEHCDEGLPFVAIHRQDDWGKSYDDVPEPEELDAAIDAALSRTGAGE